jgi:hypothetical protein
VGAIPTPATNIERTIMQENILDELKDLDESEIFNEDGSLKSEISQILEGNQAHQNVSTAERKNSPTKKYVSRDVRKQKRKAAKKARKHTRNAYSGR